MTMTLSAYSSPYAVTYAGAQLYRAAPSVQYPSFVHDTKTAQTQWWSVGYVLPPLSEAPFVSPPGQASALPSATFMTRGDVQTQTASADGVSAFLPPRRETPPVALPGPALALAPRALVTNGDVRTESASADAVSAFSPPRMETPSLSLPGPALELAPATFVTSGDVQTESVSADGMSVCLPPRRGTPPVLRPGPLALERQLLWTSSGIHQLKHMENAGIWEEFKRPVPNSVLTAAMINRMRETGALQHWIEKGGIIEVKAPETFLASRDFASTEGLITPQPVTEPESICCPIMQTMYRDPCFVPESGNTYERNALERYWASLVKPRDPLTNVELEGTTVYPNWGMRREVQRFLDEHPDYLPQGWTDRQVPQPDPVEAVALRGRRAERSRRSRSNSADQMMRPLERLRRASSAEERRSHRNAVVRRSRSLRRHLTAFVRPLFFTASQD